MTHDQFMEEPWDAVMWLLRIDDLVRRHERQG